MSVRPKYDSFDLTTVLVNYNTARLLPEVLGTLETEPAKIKNHVIVIDNASRDGSVDSLRNEYSSVQLIANKENAGFGRANNQALPFVRGRYVLLLNTDAFMLPGTLEKTITYMDSHPQCGVLGAKLIGREGDLQPSCRYFPTPWNIFLQRTGLNRLFPWVRMIDDMTWDHASARACDWVPGCFYLIRKEVIDQIGLFDPLYFLYMEEVDHCLRTKRAGWEVHYYPGTTVVHIGGESAKSDGEITEGGRQLKALQVESELLYFRKNYGLLGVWTNIALTALANLIVPAKRWLKGQRPVGWNICWHDSGMMWSLFRQTSWASQSTQQERMFDKTRQDLGPE